MMIQGNRGILVEACLSAILSTKNLICTGLGSNPNLTVYQSLLISMKESIAVGKRLSNLDMSFVLGLFCKSTNIIQS